VSTAHLPPELQFDQVCDLLIGERCLHRSILNNCDDEFELREYEKKMQKQPMFNFSRIYDNAKSNKLGREKKDKLSNQEKC